MTETGFKMNFADFDKKFAALVKSVSQETAGEGLFRAANELLTAAEDEAPTVPWLHGDLRGARKVEKPVVKSDEVSVQAGYNSPYAARLHEGEPDWNWTRTRTPNPGPKFLESKMARNARRFMQIAVDYIKSKIGG